MRFTVDPVAAQHLDGAFGKVGQRLGHLLQLVAIDQLRFDRGWLLAGGIDPVTFAALTACCGAALIEKQIMRHSVEIGPGIGDWGIGDRDTGAGGLFDEFDPQILHQILSLGRARPARDDKAD